MYSPIYVRCERGDAVLLPCRTPKKAEQVAAMKQAQDDAEQAIQDQAKAEGIDPEVLKERIERRAKRKAKAEKELADRLASYRAEMARDESFAIELDELEYLVGLIETIEKNAA